MLGFGSFHRVASMVGTHYECISVIYRLLGAKIGTRINTAPHMSAGPIHNDLVSSSAYRTRPIGMLSPVSMDHHPWSSRSI